MDEMKNSQPDYYQAIANWPGPLEDMPKAYLEHLCSCPRCQELVAGRYQLSSVLRRCCCEVKAPQALRSRIMQQIVQTVEYSENGAVKRQSLQIETRWHRQ